MTDAVTRRSVPVRKAVPVKKKSELVAPSFDDFDLDTPVDFIGQVSGMTNDDYRSPSNGFSTSNIKDFMEDPALIKWGEDAPQDMDAMAVIDFGTDFHCYFLEPKEFKKNYKVLPPCNRRVVAEKEAELALIDQWKSEGIIPCKDEDLKKLEHMRLSALAHPSVAAIMGMNGEAETSFFWRDPMTGLKLKCRPDWFVSSLDGYKRPGFIPEHCNRIVMDVKTIGNIHMIKKQIEDLKYYVQAPFYKNGVESVAGGSVCFVFVFVSTAMELGRYPVRVVVLDNFAMSTGSEKIEDALLGLSRLTDSGPEAWQTATVMSRPYYAN